MHGCNRFHLSIITDSLTTLQMVRACVKGAVSLVRSQWIDVMRAGR